MIARTGRPDRGVGGDSRAAAISLAWSLAGLSVALLLGGIALSRATGSAVPGLTVGGEETDGSVIADLVMLLTYSAVGAIVASYRPRNAIGWIFCGVGVTIGLNSFAGDYAEFWLASGFGTRVVAETAAWFSSWAWILLTYVPATFVVLLFPDGRPLSPRWRLVAWGAALGISGVVASYALEAGPLADFPQITNPYGVDDPVVGMAGAAGSILAASALAASAISLIVRLRRAGGERRQQIKWLAYWGAVMAGAIFVAGFAGLWSAAVSIGISIFALLGLPVFTGIAIVRHRLYDIDLIINLTLVYGSLTALLAAAYAGGVVGLQAAVGGLSGRESSLAVVASTLAIAAIFGPLRRRLQDLVDRRFYRRKYDAARTLAALSGRFKRETDLDRLGDDLLAAVRETVQPAHASLWLRPESPSERGPTE